jgi:thiamine pyrophosphokinase
MRMETHVGTLRILIFANGELPDLEAARRLPAPDDLILCADGGSRHARALGLTPDALIGDLDSITAEELATIAPSKTVVVRVQRDKDETDLELALDYALERDPAFIVIVGALGGRLDHTLGNIALLADPRLIRRRCSLDDGIERVVLCRARTEINGASGDLVSLVPWGGPAEGVRTDGLRWALRGETLLPERSRGISNEMLGDTARVFVEYGSVLVIHRRLASLPAGTM